MNQEAFLQALRAQLASLPPEERERYVEDYRETICDRIEDGMDETEAVRSLGDPAEIARQILDETPLRTLVKARLKPERRLKGWELALLIAGFPLWFPLLIAAGAVLFSLFLSVCAVLLALTVTGGTMALSGPAAAAVGVVQLGYGMLGSGLAALGAGLFLLGVGFLLGYAGVRLFILFFRWLARLLRRLFTKKEG